MCPEIGSPWPSGGIKVLSAQDLKQSPDGHAVVSSVSFGSSVVVGCCYLGKHARRVRAGWGKQTEPAWETVAADRLAAAQTDAG